MLLSAENSLYVQFLNLPHVTETYFEFLDLSDTYIEFLDLREAQRQAMADSIKADSAIETPAAKADSAMKKTKKPRYRVRRIVKGKRTRASVCAGGKEKTKVGTTKTNFIQNKRGKFVTKAFSNASKQRYKDNTCVQAWAKALQEARKELNIKGFVPIGGKTAAGQALLAKVREIFTVDAP